MATIPRGRRAARNRRSAGPEHAAGRAGALGSPGCRREDPINSYMTIQRGKI